MKHQWRVRRETVKRTDASERWDRAYQSILRWSLESGSTSGPSANGEEEYHAGSGICPGLDPRTGKAPDD
jgi:hypothetical protein